MKDRYTRVLSKDFQTKKPSACVEEATSSVIFSVSKRQGSVEKAPIASLGHG